MSNFNLNAAALAAMKPRELVENEAVKAKFVNLFNSIHGNDRGELVFAKEQFNFLKLINENPNLQDCSPLSLYGVFLDVAVNGLSLEQGNKPLAYVVPRVVNSEKRAYLVVSPYGEMVMRLRAGQIEHIDNPVIVYEGDIFSVYIDDRGAKNVRYEAKFPRDSKKIVACFVKIQRPDKTFDYEYLTMDDVERLRKYSERNNRSAGANKLYTSDSGQIDAGFLAAKMIKHAFRSYPKVNVKGALTVTQDEIDETEDYYGMDLKAAMEQQINENPDVAEVEEVEVIEEVKAKQIDTF